MTSPFILYILLKLMIGPILALSAAVSYALNTTLVRRAVLMVSDATLGTLISVPMGAPLFLLVLVFSGQVQSILSFAWRGYAWLSLAGILHFVVGRSFYYGCVQLVGANIAGILRRTSILVAVVLGITLLNEPFSWQLLTGVLLILIGITLTGFSPQTFQNTDGKITKIPARALILGIGCGMSWGIAPICVKLALDGFETAIAAGFISFSAATVVLSISMIGRRRRNAFTQMRGRAAVLFFSAGLLSFIANLARYVALSLAPASIVTPLVSTEPIFILMLSFVFNRKLEMFSRPVIIGSLTVVIGTVLLV